MCVCVCVWLYHCMYVWGAGFDIWLPTVSSRLQV